MKTASKHVVTALIIAVTLTACASRRKAPERPPLKPEQKQTLYNRLVTRWDFDKDGAVTCNDITVQRRSLFIELDTDNNDLLSVSEYRFARFEDKSYLFYTYQEVDIDKAPGLSFTEFNAVSHSQFVGFDRDKNCTVSIDEASDALRSQLEERGPKERPGRRDQPDVEILKPPF